MDAIYYANTAADAAEAGFADAFLYEELRRPVGERRIPASRLLGPEAMESFDAWRASTLKIDY